MGGSPLIKTNRGILSHSSNDHTAAKAQDALMKSKRHRPTATVLSRGHLTQMDRDVSTTEDVFGSNKQMVKGERQYDGKAAALQV